MSTRAIAILWALAIAATSSARPNIIVILTDDQGYGDLSAHGNPILKTPNLDRLHDESVRLTDFHVASVCTPTRGELMSGLFALRNKAGMVPAGRNLMRRDIPTMPEVFRANGYKTGLFGKWHLGDSYPHRPMDRGFDRAVWHKGWGLASEIEYDNDYYYTRYLDQLETKYSSRFCANLWFDSAMEWIGEQAESEAPFFAYLALNTPHSPFHARPEDYALYGDKVDDPNVAHFYGLIHNIDQNFARLDARLAELGIREDTLVVFLNDNGSSRGDKIFNAGRRGKKGSPYEGGHRAIGFFRWPEGLGESREVDYTAHVADVFPTLVDLAGIELPADARLDGRSLAGLITGRSPEAPDRKLIVQFGGRTRPEKFLRSAVLWDQWRLVGSDELYDLSSDPGQKTNVAQRHPKVFSEMLAHYDQYWAAIEPSIDEVEPLVLRAEPGTYTELTSNSWAEIDCDNRGRVAAACGPPRGGVWHVEAEQSGRYRVELSRWPFHLDRELTRKGPGATIGGSLIDPGKSLPITAALLAIDDAAPRTVQADEAAAAVAFEIQLAKGRHQVQGWFQDASNQDLAGAYYARIHALP